MTKKAVTAENLRVGDVITGSGAAFEGRAIAGTPFEAADLAAKVAWISVPLDDGTTMDLEAWDSPVTVRRRA